MADLRDYLLSFGTTGEFGRFRTTTAFQVDRGDAVVARSYRGLELANVLCESTAGHAHFLPNTTLGKLLRRAAAEDLVRAEGMRRRSHDVFASACCVVRDFNLPVEILDAEMMLDGKQTILHYVSRDSFDERELISRLSSEFNSQMCLHSLVLPAATDDDEHGCDRPACGRGSDGSCSSCSSGGCSGCGAGGDELQSLFASLRERLQESQRTPLA